MKTERSIGASSPSWSRVLRVVAGAVMIGMSFVAVVFPGIALGSAVVILSFVLLIAGVELIAGGLFFYRSQRAVQVGIGVLVIILAGLDLAFPGFAAFVVIGLVSFALMFSGISSLIDGVGNKRMPGWARAFSIGIGTLSIFTSGLALFSPFIGTLVVAFALAVGLAAYGTRLIASGIAGHRQSMTPSSYSVDAGSSA